jgi:hypothetical protein
MGALQWAERIDLSVPAPVWQALPNMNVARDKLNSVLLPDGRVLVLGGFETPPDDGPIEIFDPLDSASGFQAGSGSRREFHPPAPPDPGVTVSCHRALVTLVTRLNGPTSTARTVSDRRESTRRTAAEPTAHPRVVDTCYGASAPGRR